jgi:hypothetical protein
VIPALLLAALAASPDAPPAADLPAAFSRAPKPGERIDVVGFVASKYTCPPCPPGAQCEACGDSYVLLRDRREKPRAYLNLLCDVPRWLEPGQRVRVTGTVGRGLSKEEPPRTGLKLLSPSATIVAQAGMKPPAPAAGYNSVSQLLDHLPSPGQPVRVQGRMIYFHAEPCPKAPCEPEPWTYLELADQSSRDSRVLVLSIQPPEGFAKGQILRVSGEADASPPTTDVPLTPAIFERLPPGE